MLHIYIYIYDISRLRVNTVKLGTSASSPKCHSTRGNVSRGITPSSTTRIFGEYFLKFQFTKIVSEFVINV